MFSSEKSGGIFMAAMASDNLSPWQTMMSNDSSVNSQPENIGQDLPLSLDNPLGSAVDSLLPNVGERIDEVKDKIDESVATLPEEPVTPTDEVVTDSKPADEKAVSENPAVEPEVVEDNVLLEPAMSKEIVLNSGMYYFYGDHLGSSSVVTDSAGKVVQTTDYYPYGGVRHEFTDESFENDFLYTGKELDEELGIYYYGARYYMADVGRWMGEDPMVNDIGVQNFQDKYGQKLGRLLKTPQELNVYSYVANNPVKNIDPTGAYSENNPFAAMAEDNRTVANYLNASKEYSYANGNAAQKAGGFISGVCADTLNNAADMFDPGSSPYNRAKGMFWVGLDVLTVGEGGGAAKGVNYLGRVTRETEVLDLGTKALKSIKDIEGFTEHGIDQIISRGIKPSIIKDTIENTVKYSKRIDQLGRESWRYVGEKAVINLNKANRVVSGWLKEITK